MLTATEAAALREAADYLRGQSYSAHDQWTKAEARRLAEQLERVLTNPDATVATLARQVHLPLEL